MTELPIGAHYDAERQIVISGHQKGMWGGLVFGLVGVLVVDQMNQSSGARQFGESTKNSTTDLGTLTREILTEELAATHAPHWTLATGTGDLLLSPYAIFTVQKSGKARLHAMLRAEIRSPKGEITWLVRYFARAPGEFSVEGPDGWMTNDRFVEGMKAALRRTMLICIADTQNKLTGTSTVKAKGFFPYLNVDLFELPFIAVQESDTDLVARLAAGDALLMSGTHVLDRADYIITPAKFKDPRK